MREQERIKEFAADAETARRLQTIPRVGTLNSLAVEAFARPVKTSNADVTLLYGSDWPYVNYLL
jgi:hypothetical protein